MTPNRSPEDTPRCPECGEPATHATPSTGSGRVQAFCPNAHYWWIPDPKGRPTDEPEQQDQRIEFSEEWCKDAAEREGCPCVVVEGKLVPYATCPIHGIGPYMEATDPKNRAGQQGERSYSASDVENLLKQLYFRDSDDSLSVRELREESANVIRWQQQRLAELEKRNEYLEVCDTCLGHPHVSGKVCVCGGSNRSEDERQGLREAVFDAEQRIEQLTEALRQYAIRHEEIGGGRKIIDGLCMCPPCVTARELLGVQPDRGPLEEKL